MSPGKWEKVGMFKHAIQQEQLRVLRTMISPRAYEELKTVGAKTRARMRMGITKDQDHTGTGNAQADFSNCAETLILTLFCFCSGLKSGIVYAAEQILAWRFEGIVHA
ncbi:hypothetical protein DACRYDRAFT_112884, partial [Dacryopinax primogenitus]